MRLAIFLTFSKGFWVFETHFLINIFLIKKRVVREKIELEELEIERIARVNDEIKWKDDFKGEVFYSHGKSNSCGVLICFIDSKKFFIRNKLSYNDGRILILNVDTDGKKIILINLYNPITQAGQFKTLSKLTEMLTKLHLTQNNNIICAGGFNLLFNVKLESYGGNPIFNKRSVRKVFEPKETYNLTDIWRIRNHKAKQCRVPSKAPRFFFHFQ